jgi:hypothetical protein
LKNIQNQNQSYLLQNSQKYVNIDLNRKETDNKYNNKKLYFNDKYDNKNNKKYLY